MLRLMQLVAQKLELLNDLLAAELCLLVILLGRRFKAGWRSHTQQIVIGLSTIGITEVAMRAIWQAIETHSVPKTRIEYEHIMGIQEKLYNARCDPIRSCWCGGSLCLWIDEPGTHSHSETGAELPSEVTGPSRGKN